MNRFLATFFLILPGLICVGILLKVRPEEGIFLLGILSAAIVIGSCMKLSSYFLEKSK